MALPDVARRCFATVTLQAPQAADVAYGRPLPDLRLTADPTALLGPAGAFLALYRPAGSGARPVAVFATP